MKIKKAISRAIIKFNKAKITNPNLEAEILLSYIFNKSREWILTNPNNKLNPVHVIRYALCVMRRVRNTPLAYLTKNKEFYSYDFYINKNVLVPRPETELMVDEALSHITKQITHNENKKIIIIDIGTGSGCIPITIAKELGNLQSPNSKFQIHAVDISKKAIHVAKKNTEKHQVTIKFHHGNLLTPMLKQLSIVKSQLSIVITANLPYLTPTQIKNSPSVQREPRLALESGVDGLRHYKELFEQIKELSKTSHAKITCYLEIDDSQNDIIIEFIQKTLKNFFFQTKKDLRGLNRLVKLSNWEKP